MDIRPPNTRRAASAPRYLKYTPVSSAMSAHTPRLLDQVRAVLRRKHYSLRTEEAYVGWIKRYVLFHGKRHPRDLGMLEVEAFLSDLAVEQHVAASTQNQALSALLFLYTEVLQQPLEGPLHPVRAKQPQRLPTVLTRDEVDQVLDALSGVHQLMGKLLYGSGLRLMECVRLRIKDVDFAQRQIMVRDGKGGKDRVTPLPERLVVPLQEHLRRVSSFIGGICLRAMGRYSCPQPLSARRLMPAMNGFGSTSFRPGSAPLIHAVA
jgi:site-specific recombinase XerD